MSGTKENTASLDTSGNVVINPANKRRLDAEDRATEALYALVLLGDLVDSARDGELTMTAEGAQGLSITLARAQGAIRNLLDVLKTERDETGE